MSGCFAHDQLRPPFKNGKSAAHNLALVVINEYKEELLRYSYLWLIIFPLCCNSLLSIQGHRNSLRKMSPLCKYGVKSSF